MFYSVITIRLDEGTRQFENTETNHFMLTGDVIRELQSKGIENLEDFNSMKKGERHTFEHRQDGKMWFIYVARVN